MFLPILGVLAAGCAGGAALAVFTDAATVVSGWFGDFVGGLFGAPPLPHRKVTLGGLLGDAAIGCVLGAATAGLGELINLFRPAGEIPLGEVSAGERVTFSDAQGWPGHGARHILVAGLNQQDVEAAIEAEVTSASAPANGFFQGTVTVDGKMIEFNAFKFPDGTINVGTYHVVK
jgi:hypothetical protein